MKAHASAKKSSPLIWVLLVITLAVTAWTAMQKDEVDDENELLVSDKTTLNKKNSSNINTGIVVNRDQLGSQNERVENNSGTSHVSGFAWKILPRESSKPLRNLFAAHSWEPPPKPVGKPEPLPPPVAPEAPFIYTGKIEEGDGVQFFLMEQNRLINVRVGENINSEWRLEGEDVQFLQLTYLPLALPQSLSKLKKQTILAPATDEFGSAN